MDIKIALFPDLSKYDEGDLATICPRDFTCPTGFSIKGGERKFVVLRCEHQILVAIGPILGSKFYYHKHILSVARMGCCGNMDISGGGSVSFKLNGKQWYAEFGGESGDFGVYDPKILEWNFRHKVRQALMMEVIFNWSATAN